MMGKVSRPVCTRTGRYTDPSLVTGVDAMADSTRRNSRGKSTADLRRELERIQKQESDLAKQRAKLDTELAKAAEQAEQLDVRAKRPKKAKPKKRKWKEGRPSIPYPDF